MLAESCARLVLIIYHAKAFHEHKVNHRLSVSLWASYFLLPRPRAVFLTPATLICDSCSGHTAASKAGAFCLNKSVTLQMALGGGMH